MKIKTIACQQFAGLRDRSISLQDGVNLVVGKNESGKSTLVDLASRTLFQSARIDKRSDKAFCERYYPAARKDGAPVGDFVDGSVTFETADGSYTLTKEWGADARCSLSTPQGILRDAGTIDDILRLQLLYGEGVYTQMLLSTQRGSDAALEAVLDAASKSEARKELATVLAQAFAESDGVSADAVGEAIGKKIDQLAGKHWDLLRAAPLPKAGRWATGLGEVHKAYHDLEDAEAVLTRITQLETAADTAAAVFAARDADMQAAQERYDRFSRVERQLALHNERRDRAKRLQNELDKLNAVLAEWPQLAAAAQKARALQQEREDRVLLDTYARAADCAAQLEEWRVRAEQTPCPTDAELAAVREAQRAMARLENQLCGMNLQAAVSMLNGHAVTVTCLRTGAPLDLSAGAASITEAVRITVPGVMELELTPANVDVDAVQTQLGRHRALVQDMLGRCGVESMEQLQALAEQVKEARRRMDAARTRLELLLHGADLEQLRTAACAVTGTVRGTEDIERDIALACGRAELVQYIAARDARLESYAAEYGSVQALKAHAFDTQSALLQARTALEELQDLPAEYAGITDTDAHLALLQNSLRQKQALRETALTEKTAAASAAESYKEHLADDPRESARQARRVFEEKKTLLDHWLHIQTVFEQQKRSVTDSPMQDLADSFTRYLGIISGGRISSEFPDPEKMNMRVYSGSSLLSFDKLSEGSKETVSLAFRLAVLDHLFPHGGGVIVLDDPFANMDADRTAQGCALLQQCAARHQVILLTCKEEYTTLLDGHVVRL